jgi:hypothetical protein
MFGTLIHRLAAHLVKSACYAILSSRHINIIVHQVFLSPINFLTAPFCSELEKGDLLKLHGRVVKTTIA